jgi:general secretion pathway protein D
MWTVVFLLSLCAGAAPLEPPQLSVHTEITDAGVRVVPDRQVPPEAGEAERLLLEFGETNLFDLTLFFADVMRKNFLIDDENALRSKSVMLIGHEDMGLDEAWEAYLSALRVHDFTTSETGELVTVVPLTEASRRSEGVRSGNAHRGGEQIVTQLLPVTNGTAADLLSVVKPLLASEAEVIAYAPANTLIVTDTATNVAKIATLVEQLAIAAPASTLQLTSLVYAKADEVRAVIEALYGPAHEVKPIRGQPTRRTSTSSSRSSRPAPKGEATMGAAGEEARHISHVLSDERTNTLIVLANPVGHTAVEALVEELDVEVESRRSKLHVVHLTYALAEEVHAVLQGLSGGATNPEKPKPGAPKRTDLQSALDAGARMAADPTRNALAILAEEEEFAAIEELIAEIDVPLGQVFVDAVFVELTSTNNKELALGAHMLGSEGQPVTVSNQVDPEGLLRSFNVSPDLLSGLAAGVFGPSVEVAGPDGSPISVPTFGIALRALQTDSDVHVMGNPALLVVDHAEALLSVGRKIPFPMASQVPTVGPPVRTFERIDVNMELAVTPHINDSNLVTLDVALHVDEVEGAAGESDLEGGPITSGRNVESRVMVEHGQTIVLAAVAGSKVIRAESKVPILGDIPLIGALFRGKKAETRQTNLMVFLTPYVVDSPRDLTEIRAIKEAQRQEFVRRFQGKKGEEWLGELHGLLADASALSERGQL